MVQFCHLRSYLDIETVSCRLLQRMGKDEHRLKLEKVGFLMLCLQKSPKKLLVVRVEFYLISSLKSLNSKFRV